MPVWCSPVLQTYSKILTIIYWRSRLRGSKVSRLIYRTGVGRRAGTTPRCKTCQNSIFLLVIFFLCLACALWDRACNLRAAQAWPVHGYISRFTARGCGAAPPGLLLALPLSLLGSNKFYVFRWNNKAGKFPSRGQIIFQKRTKRPCVWFEGWRLAPGERRHVYVR